MCGNVKISEPTWHGDELTNNTRRYANAIQPWLARDNNVILQPAFAFYLLFILRFLSGYGVHTTHENTYSIFTSACIKVKPHCLSLPHGEEDASRLCDIFR